MTVKFILEKFGYPPGGEPAPLKMVKAAEAVLDEHNRILRIAEAEKMGKVPFNVSLDASPQAKEALNNLKS